MDIDLLEEVPPELIFDFEKALGIDYTAPADDNTQQEQEGQVGEICKYFLKGTCMKGQNCQFRHTRNDRAVVCKHWLRGLCKKGDLCEFLHEYDLAKMPECYFYSKFGECSNPECLYLHLNPNDKSKECPWYARGFCKYGMKCRHKHTKRMACENYLAGFCPEGPNCKFGHPKWDLPKEDDRLLPVGAGNFGYSTMKPRSHMICHNCGVAGHKASVCPNAKESPNPPHNNKDTSDAVDLTGGQTHAGRGVNVIPPAPFENSGSSASRINLRPLDIVTCFKCSQVGHYANKCPNKRTAPPPEGFKIPSSDGGLITIPAYTHHTGGPVPTP
eukprot:TRINITY_DN3693_c0_g4_i1.p1 TRINITY_DN3693_c0_g4~~TRINITY_DN3693_c0_g4_i1.p1  ORF type:complete len:329 (-),score=60.22 TRINITY_DN3693_c0_g4_i1:102-1088(-)